MTATDTGKHEAPVPLDPPLAVLSEEPDAYLSGFVAGVNHGYMTGRTDVSIDRSRAVEDAYRRGATAAHKFDEDAPATANTIMWVAFGACIFGCIIGRAVERRNAERALETGEAPYDDMP